jgi:hypothetical protein
MLRSKKIALTSKQPVIKSIAGHSMAFRLISSSTAKTGYKIDNWEQLRP